MKFSIIIPLYNKAEFIVRAVQSVLDQNWQKYEVLIIDDGSTDNGLQHVLDRFKDLRIRGIVQSNAGEGAARNRGLKEMRGDAAAFLDADDEWLPTHLRDLAVMAAKYPEAGVLATGYRAVYAVGLAVDHSIDRRESSLVDDYYRMAALGHAVHVSSVAVGGPLLTKQIRFAEGAAMGADEEFYARAALHAPFAYHPRISAIYHHDVAGSVMASARWSPELPFTGQSLQRMLREGIVPADRSKSASRYLAWIAGQHALSGLTCGKEHDAVALLRKANGSAGLGRGTLPLVAMRWLLQSLPLPLLNLAVRFRRSRWYFPVAALHAKALRLVCPGCPARPTVRLQTSQPGSPSAASR
jgi:hypothetical protein